VFETLLTVRTLTDPLEVTTIVITIESTALIIGDSPMGLEHR
jgi:hypothetical protein